MSINRPSVARARPRLGRGGALRPLLALCLLVFLVACDSPEEKQTRYLERGIAFYEERNDPKAMVELRNVLRLNPKNAEALYYVGLIHERAQRWPQAFAAFRGAADENPQLVKAHTKLGTLALLGNDVPAAEAAAEAIQKVAPGHPDGLVLLGAARLRQGQTQEALELAKKAIAIDPDHENGIAVQAGVLQRIGEPQAAIELVDRAIARRPQSSPLRLLKVNLVEQSNDLAAIRAAYDELIAFDPTNEAYRLALANFLQSRNDLSGAEDVLRSAVDSDYASARSIGGLASLLYRTQGFAAAEQELRRQIERDPEDHILRFLLAEFYLQEGNLPAAENELKAVIDRVGEGSVAQDAESGIAQIALSAGDVARAKSVAEKVLSVNGEHRGANLVRGTVALRDGNLDDAIRHARTALRRDPSWLPALKLVAEAHYRRGEPELAIDALNTIIAADPNDVRSAQALATLLTERGDLSSALKIWDLVLQQGDNKDDALRSRAQIAIQQQNWTAAQKDIDALLQIPEQGAQAAGALLAGNLMMAQNRLVQGREWFEKAQTIAPDAPEPLLGVIRTFMVQNDLDGALGYLEQHIQSKPDDAVALNMMGEIASRKKDLPAARAAFQRAIELQPKWANPRRRLAGTLLSEGEAGEAVQTYRAAIEAIPEDVDLLSELGSVLLFLERPEEAIEIYERVLVLQPGSEVAINNLAALIADHRHEDKAALERAFGMAQRFRASSNPLYLDTLGWLYYRKGDPAVAATYLERAVNLATDRPDLRYHLGMAFVASGQKERALLELRRATAAEVPAYPGIEEARATLARLESELQPARQQGGVVTGTNG